MSNTIEAEPNPWRSTRKVTALTARLISYVVYFYILAVEAILFLGFLLLLLGANTSAGFTEWVYRSLDRAMKPFRGIFTPIELGTAAGNEVPSVFATSVVFAMIVYAILGLAIYSFIGWLTHRLDLIERSERDEQMAATSDQLAYAAHIAATNPGGATASGVPAPGPARPAPSTTPPTSH